MDRGTDFLKSQVNNAVAQHKVFLEALEDHEKQAEDIRFRDLCSRHIPNVREHQRMLEDYQQTLGAEAGAGKSLLGAVVGKARRTRRRTGFADGSASSGAPRKAR